MNGKVMFVIGYAGFCAVGFGVVASHVVATAVTRTFSRQRGVAVGTATSGATGGQFVIVPLIAVLLSFASWRWCFGALALGSLALIPCIRAMMREVAGDRMPEAASGIQLCAGLRPHHPTSGVSSPVLELSDLRFHLIGAIETHLLPFAAFCGFPPLQSATAYGVLSLVNLFGMIGAGWLSDRVNRPMLLAVIYFLRAMTYIILINLPGTGIEVLFLFAILFGIVDYSTVPVTASLAASHIGIRVMGQAMGMISAGHALGSALAAYLGGYLLDTTGSYEMLWLGSAGFWPGQVCWPCWYWR